MCTELNSQNGADDVSHQLPGRREPGREPFGIVGERGQRLSLSTSTVYLLYVPAELFYRRECAPYGARQLVV